MKARLLRKLLNNTGYTIADHGKYIGIGSPMCHNLLSVDKETLKIKYAIDTFKKGKKSLTCEALVVIWDKLDELIESGELQEIITGQDQLDNPLPVYTVTDGKLIETLTDEYGWPNVTIDGQQMYDNNYFKTKVEAIQYGIDDTNAGLKFLEENLARHRDDIQKLLNRQEKEDADLTHLTVLLAEQSPQ